MPYDNLLESYGFKKSMVNDDFVVYKRETMYEDINTEESIFITSCNEWVYVNPVKRVTKGDSLQGLERYLESILGKK